MTALDTAAPVTDEATVLALCQQLLEELPPKDTDAGRVPRSPVRPRPGLGALPRGPRRPRPVAAAAADDQRDPPPGRRADRGLPQRHRPRHGRAHHRHPRHRGAEGRATSARSSPARRCGASSSPSPGPAPTSPASPRRAVRDGDEWIVNGQKVWTTLAHLAKWGMLVARTDPDAAEAQGHDLLRRRHARARRRGATALPDHRRGRVQRGVLHRRPHPRRGAARRRRRGLAGHAHHADERAGGHRRRHPRQGRRVHRRGRQGVGSVGRRTTRATQGRADGALGAGRGAAAHQHPGQPAPRGRQPRAGGIDRQGRCRPTSTRTSARSPSTCSAPRGC